MFKNRDPHLLAVLQALLVTFLWSTSWVFIKVGLRDMPALSFAGLRYTLAFACLLPFVLRPATRESLRALGRADWARLAVLGVCYYSLAQGGQFLSLAYLPAITVSLLLSFTSVVVVLLGIALLAERPTPAQWGGIGLSVAGVLVFFYPVELPGDQWIGLGVAALTVLANAGGAILGRHVNRAATIPPLVVTVVSMGIGAILLLGVGIATQGLPALGPAQWAIVGWLAVVNTAFTFTLWNHTQRTLPAMESSIIGNTMMIQIALLAWIFLDESLTLPKAAGMLLAAIGTLIVQLRRR
jgi:drug/metabolite transporter (DMT)-like permease